MWFKSMKECETMEGTRNEIRIYQEPGLLGKG